MALRKSLLWLPLSLPIFCVDIVQRGFASFAKTTSFAVPNLTEALSIYFLVVAFGILLFGFVCDNFNARKVLLFSMTGAAVGMAVIPYTPWGFGLIFGSSAALIKVAPFSAPLKLINKNEGLNISPQAAAKNVSGALFILVIAGLLVSLGWITTTMLLAVFIFLCGLTVYFTIPNDKIDGWKWHIFVKLVKDWKFWAFGINLMLVGGGYYGAISGFLPALVKTGYTKIEAANLVAFSFLLCGMFRFLAGWLGDKQIKGHKLHLPIMWFGALGMWACIPITASYPLLSLFLFSFIAAFNTPNYWPYSKHQWGATYVSTVVSIGFFFMYIGASAVSGKWLG